MLETDLVAICLRLEQENDFSIVHHTDVPHNASDQRGHVDGAFARNHLLPMSKHAPDGRETNLVCHNVQILQLKQAIEVEVCTRVHDHGEPLGKKPQSRIMDGDYVVLAIHRFIRN